MVFLFFPSNFGDIRITCNEFNIVNKIKFYKSLIQKSKHIYLTKNENLFKLKPKMCWVVDLGFQTQGLKRFTNKYPIGVDIFNLQELKKVSLEKP